MSSSTSNPTPGHGPQPVDGHVDAQPTFGKTIWNARMTIPQHTPLTDVLTRMRTMNATIAEVGEIVTTQSPAVLRLVADLGQEADLRAAVSYEEMVAHAEQIRVAAKDKTQLGYATYCRLRAGSVADTIAVTLAARARVPPRSNRSAFVASVLNAWMRRQPAWSTDDPHVLEAALGPLDIPFRVRRAEFVLQGINALFTAPRTTARMHPQLRAMKTECWNLLAGLRGQARQLAAAVRDTAEDLFGAQSLSEADVLLDPELFLLAGPFGHAAQLDDLYNRYHQAAVEAQVAGSSKALWDVFAAQTEGWADDVRAQLAGALSRLPHLGLVDLPGDRARQAAPALAHHRAALQPARRERAACGRRARRAQGRRAGQAGRCLDRALRRLLQALVARERLPVGPARRHRAGPAAADPAVRWRAST